MSQNNEPKYCISFPSLFSHVTHFHFTPPHPPPFPLGPPSTSTSDEDRHFLGSQCVRNMLWEGGFKQREEGKIKKSLYGNFNFANLSVFLKLAKYSGSC